MLERVTSPLLAFVPDEVRRAANPWAFAASLGGGTRVDVPVALAGFANMVGTISATIPRSARV